MVMKRLRAQHANSPSVHVHVCEEVTAPVCAERVVKETPVHSEQATHQQSLVEAWGGACRTSPPLEVASTDPNKKLTVDLYCGIGGFSTGADRAGHHVVLAVDSDAKLLHIHRRNHPACNHLRLRLGPDSEEKLVAAIHSAVPKGRKWHLHGSPPCTMLSGARAFTTKDTAAFAENKRKGTLQVMWYLRLVNRLQPTSWTLEQVPTPELDGVLSYAQFIHPDNLSYAKFIDMDQYGIGQTRRRCIAGSPELMRHLLTNESIQAPAPAIGQVLTPPHGATLCRASTGKCADPAHTIAHANGTFTNNTIRNQCFRGLDEVAFTCCASNRHYWSRPDFTTVRTFTLAEMATLQTFPPTYKFGPPPIAFVGIGNAVPPRFAQKLMEGATAT